MARLLIVSNRLPLTIRHEHGQMKVSRSSGGLATALQGPHSRMDSLWMGWTGDSTKLSGSEQKSLDDQLSSIRAVGIHLSQAEVHQFYDGFSNGVLWPLYHYLTGNVHREAWANWKTFVEVNQKFADAVIKTMAPGDLVWIHDYQLSLVPAMIRQKMPEAVIGFFLHIPFPSSEVYRILPWRAEILQGMLGADLIGFHTYSYLHHFSRSLMHILDLESDGTTVRLGNRKASLGVFPIGIDVGRFETLAVSAPTRADLEKFKAEAQGRRVILGIDRLDYTKGLPRRIMAFDRLLERDPSLRDKVKLVQVVVPSREKVEAYASLKRELDEMVGRINSTWGSVSTVPIHFLYRNLSAERLSALYRAADVMLVTPLRDGMNLVAKEFVASRVDDDGVLVLSEFAGAAAELVEAVIVNPYDVDQMALQIKRALAMKPNERRARMRSLRARVRGFDAFLWADSFIEALQIAPQGRMIADSPRASSSEEIQRLSAKVRGLSPLHAVLDYDGTLVPFAQTPELAIPDPELLTLLQALAARPDTFPHIISGRTRETLDDWFGSLPVSLVAEHGFWSRSAGKKEWIPSSTEKPTWIPRIRGLLAKACHETPGSFIEEKSGGLAWHYRLVTADFGRKRADSLVKKLYQERKESPFEVLEGEKVVEVRTAGINKGLLIKRLLEETSGTARFLVMGDDRTDEDMFQAVGSHGVSVHVGPGPSMAHFRLEGFQEARRFLQELLPSMPSPQDVPHTRRKAHE